MTAPKDTGDPARPEPKPLPRLKAQLEFNQRMDELARRSRELIRESEERTARLEALNERAIGPRPVVQLTLVQGTARRRTKPRGDLKVHGN
jgi:hypothetical protein